MVGSLGARKEGARKNGRITGKDLAMMWDFSVIVYENSAKPCIRSLWYSLHGHQIVAHWVGNDYRCQVNKFWIFFLHQIWFFASEYVIWHHFKTLWFAKLFRFGMKNLTLFYDSNTKTGITPQDLNARFFGLLFWSSWSTVLLVMATILRGILIR